MCTPFTRTSTYPSLPTRVQGTTCTFTLAGTCSGVDAAGKAYTLSTMQNFETYYSRGGGKGGGGAGWKVLDTGGTTTITYP
jgi:hypothetical protein